MAGTSGGDVALFHDLSTAAYNNRQRTTSSDKTIDHAFEDIGTMADSLALPKAITDRAKYIFKDVHDRKLLKGRSIHLIASACLHIACRCVIFLNF
jgi:transcription initiation factor TFIIIB Brf1 subunit/transcription initiation factor TFIIB